MKKIKQKVKRAVLSKKDAAKIREIVLQTITRKLVRQ